MRATEANLKANLEGVRRRRGIDLSKSPVSRACSRERYDTGPELAARLGKIKIGEELKGLCSFHGK